MLQCCPFLAFSAFQERFRFIYGQISKVDMIEILTEKKKNFLLSKKIDVANAVHPWIQVMS